MMPGLPSIRLGLAIIPICGWMLSNHVCNRLPGIMERGLRGMAGRAVSNRNIGRVLPFGAALAIAIYLGAVDAPTVTAIGLAGFMSVLAFLAAADAEYAIIPDFSTIPALIAGLVLASCNYSVVTFPEATAGAVGGYVIGQAMRRTLQGAGASFGLGDVKLLGLIGAWIGPLGFFCSLIIGLTSAYFSLKRIKNKRLSITIALAPHLFVGTGIMTVLYATLFVRGWTI